MTVYSYRAMDRHGQRTSGWIEADHTSAAAGQLRAQSLMVLSLEVTSDEAAASADRRRGLGWLLRWPVPVRTQDKILLLEQLALLLRSGLTIVDALDACRRQTRKPQMHRVLTRVMEAVERGERFSSALARQRGFLSASAIGMVRSAEATGQLTLVLDQLVRVMTGRRQLRAALLTGMTYPVVLVLLTIGVVAYLVTTVIPKFESFLSNRHMVLPDSTRLLIGVSTWLREHGGHLGLAALLTTFTILVALRFRTARLVLHTLALHLPIIGNLLRLALMLSLARMLAVLLASGHPLLESLDLLTGSLSNELFRHRLNRISIAILQDGRSLSRSLEAERFDPVFCEAVRVGELTGSLDHVLSELAKHYETRLSERIRWLTTLFEPALLLAVGALVAFVYFSFFQVLFRASAGQ
ncbi:MAG: type II secretion system F family protein [Planctomycetes bacterium]|nr:type II secretion system F family protein [Planctomycetota bacterium]